MRHLCVLSVFVCVIEHHLWLQYDQVDRMIELADQELMNLLTKNWIGSIELADPYHVYEDKVLTR